MDNTKINECIEKLYNLKIERLKSIVEVFNDYYGEARVDFIPVPFESFLKTFRYRRMDYICHTIAIYKNVNEITESENSDISEKDLLKVINDLIDNDSYLGLDALSDIIVYFPQLSVTNENNRSTTIYNTFIKITFTINGLMYGNFKLQRTTYTYAQAISGYKHSHAPRIYNYREAIMWVETCLGNGPIRNTCRSLRDTVSLDFVELFCLELDKYVHTESLTGGPYIKLESISSSTEANLGSLYFLKMLDKLSGNQLIYKNMLNEFISYFIEQKILKFNHINEGYSLAYSSKFVLVMSNMFIKWFNTVYKKTKYDPTYEDLLSAQVLTKCTMHNGRLFKVRNNYRGGTSEIIDHDGEYVTTFKGKKFKFEILNIPNEDDNTIITLHEDIVNYILINCLKIVNHELGKYPTSTSEEVYYI